MLWPVLMTIILFAQHLVFKDVMHICFTIVDLCYLNFCVSLPQWELCYLCQYAVCAVSIWLQAYMLMLVLMSSSVNNRPINNSLLTANGKGTVRLQPIRVQELPAKHRQNRCNVKEIWYKRWFFFFHIGSLMCVCCYILDYCSNI